MVPQPIDETLPTPRQRRRERMARFAFGLNGAIFLVAAWDGLDTGGSRLGVIANGLFGAIQLAALVRSQTAPLPERLGYSLAAAGMVVSAALAIHHRSGIAVAYALAGSFNLALAVWGPERIRALVRRNPG